MNPAAPWAVVFASVQVIIAAGGCLSSVCPVVVNESPQDHLDGNSSILAQTDQISVTSLTHFWVITYIDLLYCPFRNLELALSLMLSFSYLSLHHVTTFCRYTPESERTRVETETCLVRSQNGHGSSLKCL